MVPSASFEHLKQSLANHYQKIDKNHSIHIFWHDSQDTCKNKKIRIVVGNFFFGILPPIFSFFVRFPSVTSKLSKTLARSKIISTGKLPQTKASDNCLAFKTDQTDLW